MYCIINVCSPAYMLYLFQSTQCTVITLKIQAQLGKVAYRGLTEIVVIYGSAISKPLHCAVAASRNRACPWR
jgi:hypothetical protein